MMTALFALRHHRRDTSETTGRLLKGWPLPRRSLCGIKGGASLTRMSRLGGLDSAPGNQSEIRPPRLGKRRRPWMPGERWT